jgi:hypothetical protein
MDSGYAYQNARRKKGSSATMVVLIASTWLSTIKRERFPPTRKKIKEKL